MYLDSDLLTCNRKSRLSRQGLCNFLSMFLYNIFVPVKEPFSV